jgi:hypothetical protein
MVHVPQKRLIFVEPSYNLQITEICISWPVSNGALCHGEHFFEEIPVIGCKCGHGGRFPSKRPTSRTPFYKCSSTRVFTQAKAVWRDYAPAQRNFIMLGTIVWYVRRTGIISCGQIWEDYAGMMLERSSRLSLELSAMDSTNRPYFSSYRGRTTTCLENGLSVTL